MGCDAQITEVVVILDKSCVDRLDWAVGEMSAIGLRVTRADDDNSVVEGDIETQFIPKLEKLECVDYVRQVFTYVADFPTGDPRDKDGN